MVKNYIILLFDVPMTTLNADLYKMALYI